MRKDITGTVGLIALGILAFMFFPTLITVMNNQAMMWMIGLIALAYFLSKRWK